MITTAGDVVRLVSLLASRDRRLAVARRGGHLVTEPTALERALVDASNVLQGAGIPYALIGGVAVAVHTAQARATQDVDLAVRSDVDRDTLIATFLEGPFTLRGRHAHSVNFVHDRGDPLQLALDPAFDAAIARAETFRLGGATIRVVQRDDLIALKELAAADPRRRRSKALRDRADVEMLRGDVPDPDEGW